MNIEKKQLLNMMEEIDDILKENNLTYFLAYGSVLGAIREKGFIPWDDEIDIVIPFSQYNKILKVLKDNLSNQYQVSDFDTEGYELFFPRVHLKNKNHHLNHIDLFPLIGLPNNRTKKRIYIERLYLLNKMYYVKMLNHKKIYKNRPIRRIQSLIIKTLLSPISVEYFKNKLLKLANEYDLNESYYAYTLGGSYKMREVFEKEVYSETKRVKFEDLNLAIPFKYDKYLKQIYGENYMTPKKENYLS